MVCSNWTCFQKLWGGNCPVASPSLADLVASS